MRLTRAGIPVRRQPRKISSSPNLPELFKEQLTEIKQFTAVTLAAQEMDAQMRRSFNSIRDPKIYINGKVFNAPEYSSGVRANEFVRRKHKFILVVKEDLTFMCVGQDLQKTLVALRTHFEKLLPGNPAVRIHLCPNAACSCSDPAANNLPLGTDAEMPLVMYEYKD